MTNKIIAKLDIDSDRCKGCGLCIPVCPKNILEIDKSKVNAKGYNPIRVTDEKDCIACAGCARVCPDLVFEISKEVKK